MKQKEGTSLKQKSSPQTKGNPVTRFLWIDKRRRAKNLNFLLTVVVIAVAAALGYVCYLLGLIDTGGDGATNFTFEGQEIYEDEELDIMRSIDAAGSWNDYLKQWANNGGTPMSSKNVINVLLIGLDSADGLEKGGRSDTLILVSINKKTQKINMTSLFRDTWTYMYISGSKDWPERYGKINSSYFYGGPTALIDTIEKDFKIDIDHYVAVDFSSFTDIINALGGLTIDVEEREAEYIRRTSTDHKEFPYGKNVKLNGWQALVYARIRKLDSDVGRTQRQRKVIMALMDSARGASLSQLTTAVETLFRYVKTDLSKMEILSYSSEGLRNGWPNYAVTETTIADDDVFRAGMFGETSLVAIDFELAAQRIQTAIYGESNIELAEDRVIPFDLVTLR